MSARYQCPFGHSLINAPFEQGLHPFPTMACMECPALYMLMPTGQQVQVDPLGPPPESDGM
jgi:hypothetical protein